MRVTADKITHTLSDHCHAVLPLLVFSNVFSRLPQSKVLRHVGHPTDIAFTTKYSNILSNKSCLLFCRLQICEYVFTIGSFPRQSRLAWRPVYGAHEAEHT